MSHKIFKRLIFNQKKNFLGRYNALFFKCIDEFLSQINNQSLTRL